jgi:exonuclease SbcC
MAKNADEIRNQQTKISQLQKEYSHILSGVGYIQQQVSETSKQISALENLIQAEASKAPVYQEQPAIAAHVTTILNNTSKRTQYLSNQNKKAQELTPKNNELTNAKNEADAAEDALKNHLEDQKKLDEQLEKADLPTKRRQKDEKIREKNAVEILSNDVQALENTDNQITEKRKRLQKIEQELAQLDEDKEQKTKHQEQANSTLLEAERKKQVWADTINDWAKAMRQKLQVGDICPVCRQQVTHIEVESLLDQKYQEAVEEYNKAKKDADDITSKIAEIDANIKAKTQEQKDKQSEIQKQEKDIANLQDYCKSQCEKYQIAYSDDIATTKTHIQEYITQADAEIKALEETIEKGEKIEKQLRESNNKLNKLQENKDKKEKRFNEIKEQINTINTEITILKNNVQSCEENIKTASTKIHQFLQDTTWQHDWKIELEDFAQELKAASEKYQNNKNELSEAQQLKQKYETSLSSIQDQIDKLLELMPEWRSIVATDKTDMSDIQNQVNQLVADVQTAISRHADATRKKEDDEREYNTYIAQYPIDESTPVILQLEERIRQSRSKGEKLQQQIGEIKATLKQNADNCDKIADLHKKMQQLEGPKAMWNKLCNTLGLGTSDGKYFRIIAQSYVLSSLVNAANRYLAMLTNSRYRLTITLGSFLILIEDAENAYTKRSTGTISGGESFLVSLSLALALSDIGTLSVDTLFIDEGFGSLSGEALDNAINTLYSLHRTCGRKVGIISHIEDLRERIPVKIQVEQQANLSSSKVTVVS